MKEAIEEIILDRLETYILKIRSQKEEIFTLYGYKNNCEVLNNTIKNLKQELELKETIIADQKAAIEALNK